MPLGQRPRVIYCQGFNRMFWQRTPVLISRATRKALVPKTKLVRLVWLGLTYRDKRLFGIRAAGRMELIVIARRMILSCRVARGTQ